MSYTNGYGLTDLDQDDRDVDTDPDLPLWAYIGLGTFGLAASYAYIILLCEFLSRVTL